jgi:hypothetical protein
MQMIARIRQRHDIPEALLKSISGVSLIVEEAL